jgi:hypothetical protein
MSPRIFGRSREQIVEPQLEIEEFDTHPAPIDPHEFILGQEARLLQSGAEWGKIAKTIKSFKEDYREDIYAGLVDVWNANTNGAPLPNDEHLADDTDKVAVKLSIYSALTARNGSVDGINIRTGSKTLQDAFLQIPDHTINYILRSKRFPTRRFLGRQSFLLGSMTNADDIGRSVLFDLTQSYAFQPTDVTQLADLYRDGASSADRAAADY